jgi:3-oxoadipate enol-lactonase
VSLPGRGDTWVWDTGGSSGAPALLLVHGWTSTAALTWWPAFRRLGRDFRVLAMDQRGHGRGIRTRRFRLEDCADDLAALVESLGGGPVVVAGYSMGGPIAQLLWRRHPDAVGGLVLCATACRFSSRPELAPAASAIGTGLSVALSSIPPALRRQWLARAIRGRGGDPAITEWVVEEQQGSDPASLVQAAVALSAFDSSAWLRDIDVPTSVVVTMRDRTVSPVRQWHLARTIPGAGAFTVAGDHRACAEQPGEFVPKLLEACRWAASDVAKRPATRSAASSSPA